MAFCFWTRGEEPLAKALIGSRLFQQMAKVGESEHILDDIVEKLKHNSEYSLLIFSYFFYFWMQNEAGVFS